MTEKGTQVRVRMAPSPTGFLHIGTARATLFNYLFAKRNGGIFILRSEDTDKERSKKEYEDDILSGLEWLGLKWDEFYRQSERTDIYVSYVKKMLADGSAYLSKEEPKEEGQRSEVIRFRNPNKKIAFEDMIRGTIEVDTTDLGDFVIARSEAEPLYHLAVVVDDFEMGVTHVIRGEDHISNTPRQILIQEAIGAPRPVYAHLPLIFDNERKKLSKRKHGEIVWIDTYRKEGYMPEALLNFFALMGWNPGTEKEIFTLDELAEAFDIKRVQKGAAVYNLEKLRWINKEHMKREREKSELAIGNMLRDQYGKDVDQKIIALAFERIEVLGDLDKLLKDGEFDYFFKRPELDKGKLGWKDTPASVTKEHLEKVLETLPGVSDPTMENVKEALMPYAEEAGRGAVLWPVRYALSGREKSPDPFTLISILGVAESEARLKEALRIMME